MNTMAESLLGTLFVVATPIGNLSDMTPRAIHILRSVSFILCEDTRVTKKLLHHFSIDTPVMTYHHHSDEKTMKEVVHKLQQGLSLALVSDAGTPAISDPGGLLVEYLQRNEPTIRIEAIAGVSAVTAALSISGFAAERFVFLGFPPHKQKRKQFFEEVAQSPYTVVFYESPYRIKKAIDQLTALCAPNRHITICRELTKKFESRYSGTIEEIQQMTIPEKGEFVVVVEGNKNKPA